MNVSRGRILVEADILVQRRAAGRQPSVGGGHGGVLPAREDGMQNGGFTVDTADKHTSARWPRSTQRCRVVLTLGALDMT